MSEIKTGGPAFPEIFTDIKQVGDLNGTKISDVYSCGGMTMRDYFAAKALDGLISIGAGNHNMPDFQFEMAVFSYGYADAMIKAREA